MFHDASRADPDGGPWACDMGLTPGNGCSGPRGGTTMGLRCAARHRVWTQGVTCAAISVFMQAHEDGDARTRNFRVSVVARSDDAARRMVGAARGGGHRAPVVRHLRHVGRFSERAITVTVPTSPRSIRRKEIFGDSWQARLAAQAWLVARVAAVLPGTSSSCCRFPALFRVTCYYYRGAYYKALWADPPSC